jgi:hypothetical protein
MAKMPGGIVLLKFQIKNMNAMKKTIAYIL